MRFGASSWTGCGVLTCRLLRRRRDGRRPTRWRSTPSGRARRSTRRACTARSRRSAPARRPSRRASGPRRAGRSASCWRTVPTRQGTHCPHDSLRKNAAMRISIRGRSTVSSITSTTPEPSVVFPARASSKVSGRSSSSGRTKPPAAPPSSIVCSARPSGHATGELEQLAERRAEGRPRTRPGARRDRRGRTASCRSTPRCRSPENCGPPPRITSSTLTSVSTLLITVGLPNSPATTGNGGLFRGSPR